MNVVFLVHYFPPLNSAGARRIHAFAKYLSSWGHRITVISTRKTERDGLLTEPVPDFLRLFEINSLGRLSPSAMPAGRKSVKNTEVETRSATGRALLKIKRAIMDVTGQLIDHRLTFALSFVSPALATEVRTALEEADVVISSCPPWPIHLAGRFVQKRYGKHWIADYRDQFSGNHILRGSVLSRALELRLERWLLRAVDSVIVISDPMREYYQQFHPKVRCIENGYDEQAFEQVAREDASRVEEDDDEADALVIRYMGTITADRIPRAFLQALGRINQQPGRPVVAEFYGESTLLRKALASVAPEAVPYVRFQAQLPFVDSIRRMLRSDALFFIETSDLSSLSARGVLTTKLFEYFAARKPIVAEISRESLAARYIGKSGLGVVVSQDVALIQQAISRLRDGEIQIEPDNGFIDSLSRMEKTRQLEELLIKDIDGEPSSA